MTTTTTVEHDGFRFLVRENPSDKGHVLPVRLPKTRNRFALAGDKVIDWLRELRRHVFGIVVTLVALAFVGSVVVGLVLENEPLAAILAGWIGGLGIGYGIAFHVMGAA